VRSRIENKIPRMRCAVSTQCHPQPTMRCNETHTIGLEDESIGARDFVFRQEIPEFRKLIRGNFGVEHPYVRIVCVQNWSMRNPAHGEENNIRHQQ